MKLGLGRKQTLYLVVFIVAVAVLAGGLVYYKMSPREMRRYNFHGIELVFRDDLRSAKNISVYPDDESIMKEVWNPNVYIVKLVYVPTEEPSDENGILSTNAFEIRFKLGLGYNQFDWGNEFTSSELKSFENISYANDTLVIALVRPSLSDKTAVELHGNVIYIKGKTPQEFDRATIRFLMAALNITI